MSRIVLRNSFCSYWLFTPLQLFNIFSCASNTFSAGETRPVSRVWIKRFKDYRSALNPPVVRNVCQRDKYPLHKYYFLPRDKGAVERIARHDAYSYDEAVSFSSPFPPFFFYSLAAARNSGRRRRVPRASRIWKNRMRSRGRCARFISSSTRRAEFRVLFSARRVERSVE